MGRLVSKTGGESLSICVWVASLEPANEHYEQILERNADKIKGNIWIDDPEYHDLYEIFLRETNQEIVND